MTDTPTPSEKELKKIERRAKAKKRVKTGSAVLIGLAVAGLALDDVLQRRKNKSPDTDESTSDHDTTDE